MPAATKPNNWRRIERDIKIRADFRCECGTGYHCDGAHHRGRCPNIEGNRYPHNGRNVKLRVVQVKPGPDWRPKNLVALCLRCYTSREDSTPQTKDEQNGLFDHLYQ